MTENKARVVVVLTTADYIDYLRKVATGKFLFLTARQIRATAREEPPPPEDEVLLTDLSLAAATAALRAHCERFRYGLIGVMAFDCESLRLAAEIAKQFNFAFSSVEAITTARNKHLAKECWRKFGLRCPQSMIVENESELRFFACHLFNGTVLKPISGAGSELTFFAENAAQAVTHWRTIEAGLAERREQLLFADSRVIAEEFCSGEEYSADFVFSDRQAQVIRVSKKEKFAFGITGAYQLIDWRENKVFHNLAEQLAKAATALGLRRALAMVDFFVVDNKQIVFLELTPRPGGDCLPQILLAAGFDILRFAAEFSEKTHGPIRVPPIYENLAGLQLFAAQAGIVRDFTLTELQRDERVVRIYLKRRIGERIELPPTSWNSWNWGSIIYRPRAGVAFADQNRELRDKARMIVE